MPEPEAPTTPYRKLDVFGVLESSTRGIVVYRRPLAAIMLFPGIGFVVLEAIGGVLQEGAFYYFALMVVPYSLVTAWLLGGLHRFVLALRSGAIPEVRARFGRKEVYLFVWLLLLDNGVFILIVLFALFGLLSNGPAIILVGLAVLAVPYFYARLCFVYPAAAKGDPTDLRTAWRQTRGNGLRILGVLFFSVLMAFILLLFPGWLTIALLHIILPDSVAQIFSGIVATIFGVIGLTIRTAAISLSYHDLVASDEQPDTNAVDVND